jgi:predicted RNA-binding Zn-ribbon protein involved in translation (DUF1610 family)
VRRICPHCIEEDSPSLEILRELKLHGEQMDFTPKKGTGCEHCNQIGYAGRIGLFEVFPVDGELKKMIHHEATETELMRASKWTGMTTLLDDAHEKLQQGVTTCEEVLRVLGPQNHVEIPCPQCGFKMEERYPFCPSCGNPVIPRCRACKKVLNPSWHVCPFCGEKQ